ncbi:hypothetical protein [Pedobacter hartonius]|uniref:DUF1640 domain-containing protein n=1 Tax=Pedobacter hartonius TaxID=425514 RepID=A0A1H3XRR2_9SPHI|nr:hypothetical protein [Pedobacter hartonius]SEA01264.1 hypothetical protein SAMN05443550_101685 [Pedobacter hartonius]
MENQNSSIRLFQLIKNKTNEQTALDAIQVFQHAIKEEVKSETAVKFEEAKIEQSDKFNVLTVRIGYVKTELTEKISNLKVELTERISDVKTELNDVKFDLIDRINFSKIQTILWIVRMTIVQLLARYFFK